MVSQPGLQTITIHILPNIARSKDNQAMKFGQFIEDNRNHSQTHFPKIKIEHISMS